MKRWSPTNLFSFLLIAVACSVSVWINVVTVRIQPETIKVGILHSMTGVMAVNERSLIDMLLLGIEEINEQGGLLGQLLEPVVVDGRSDAKIFAAEAERLITQEKVAVLFGCWQSSARKAVKDVVERHNHLLCYAVQYEGLEQSPNILYTGAVPNQQIIPGVAWCLHNKGKKMFLVGSDNLYSHCAHEVIKQYLSRIGGEVVGDQYIPLGSRYVTHVIDAIKQAQPEVIINTIDDESIEPFYKELRAAEFDHATLPSMLLSVSESQLADIGVSLVEGDYAAWNYVQGLVTQQNKQFVARVQKKYGLTRVISDADVAAYTGLYLWVKAVRDAGTLEISAVRKVLGAIRDISPQGVVSVDQETNHIYKPIRIVRATLQGRYKVIWDSGRPVKPEPYPQYQSVAKWQQWLQNLVSSWGGWEKQARL